MESGHCACIDGWRILVNASIDNVNFAMNYEPQEGDVIIAGYPKSGTTWTQYIVSSIFTSGNPAKTSLDFMLSSPNIEVMGADAIRTMPRPGAFKTHLPLSWLKYSPRAKYIYVARNPFDCCVSFYYFVKQFTPKESDVVSFDTFLNAFLSGNLLNIDYFDHLISWYGRRNDPNLLFLTYEDLKQNTSHWILRIADFLGEEYGSGLRRSETLLQKILQSCAPENMRAVLTDSTFQWIQKALDLPPEKRIASMEVYRQSLANKKEMHRADSFVRKGFVGDWRSEFTSEQVDRMKAVIEEKTSGIPDVMSIWDDSQLALCGTK